MLDQVESDIAPPKVMSLAALLEHQEKSIVSRVLLKNKGGTVTLFAFAAGEGLSEHTAPFDALVIVTEGEADISIDGELFKVNEGESILLPANHPHAVAATTQFKMLLIMIRA